MKTPKNHVEPNQNFPIFGGVKNVLPFKLKMMKSIMSILMAVLIISVCKSSPEKKLEPGRKDSLALMAPDCDANILCKYCCKTDNHKIKFDSVFIMIRNFQKTFGASGINAGAVFGKTEISLTTDSFLKDGNNLMTLATTAFYPCMEKIDNVPKFYLSTQPRLCQDTQADPACSTSVEFVSTDQVYRSSSLTYFDCFQSADLVDINQLQTTIFRQRTVPRNCVLDNDLVRNSQAFKEEYGFIHESPAMIYQKGITVMELLNLTPRSGRTNAGIRYYFGIDFMNSKHPLRVLLCAVDDTGEIIVPKKIVGGIEVDDWDLAFRESSRPRRP